jgi:hypothetical protein
MERVKIQTGLQGASEVELDSELKNPHRLAQASYLSHARPVGDQ